MASRFQIVPVLDVLGSRAVHAVGGDRSRYRPLRSILHAEADPRELALAFRDQLGLSTIYLADLDAITRRANNTRLYDDLLDLGLNLWLDPGLRDELDLRSLPVNERLNLIAGLESLASPGALAALRERIAPERLIVSLDLRDERPILSAPEAWETNDAATIASRVVAMGVRRLILLDLARVGEGAGTGTKELLLTIRAANPSVEIIVGGGVASMADVDEVRDQGAAAVLIGSALHDGRIGRREVDRSEE